ncbi:hypothetical protein [Photobacterium angustum]|uniref:hypothetical protein n=1 Tax=Photobacterium angustum TaxID=661 RepID=UPI0005E9AA20|nr:hypothetical protein [Photobacterium angustum]KJF98513.1 hypothetical protein UB35_21175 [Photobacterium angustum]
MITTKKKLEKDAYCTLLIKEKRNGKLINYASLVGDSLDGLASGKNSPHYDGLGQTAKVNEGYWEEDNVAYKITRTFNVSGVKEWTWTKGKKISDSGKNRDLLYKKYIVFYKMLKENNTKELLDFFRIGLSEKAENDNSTIENEWKSLGIPQMLEDGYKPRLENIKDYKVVTYADGKLFRLEDESGYPPITMIKGKHESVLNPYFAYVDGKIISAL